MGIISGLGSFLVQFRDHLRSRDHLRTRTASADTLKCQLKDLSQKIHATIQPVIVSHKIEQDLTLREVKPPVVKQQYLVYQFKCDLCDAGYVNSYSLVH